MPTVNWGSSGLGYAGTQRVYIKQTWAAPWSYQGNIWCNEAAWSLLPSMPVANFELDYGYVLPHGSTNWVTQSKLGITGWYVKVEIDCQDGQLVWIGFLDEVVDEQGGITQGVASGRQRWVAYGMPQALAYETITRGRWYDEPNTTNRWSGSAITFNKGGRPNRTATVPTADPGKEQTHLFAPIAPKTITNATPWTDPEYWTSQDIAHYLQEHATPVDQAGNVKIPFRIDNRAALPNWDKPTIETEGRTLLDVLNELVNPGRLLQMSTQIDNSTTPHTVVLKIHSLVDSALSLPDSNTHPANLDRLQIQCVGSQDTNITVQASASRSYHQIVCKGAKRQTVATFSCTQPAGSADALAEGWTTSDETDYEDGASNEAGYGAKSDEEKRRANENVRAQAQLTDVYRSLVINPDWDFDLGSSDFVFEEDDGTTQYFPWWDDITIAPTLPLKTTVDYTANPLPDDDDAKPEYRPPYVLFQRPSSSPAEYIQAEKMANLDGDPSFSVEIGLTKDNKGITLDVVGGNQHAIADTRFTALSVDEDEGDWDYLDAKYTLAWTEDRYAEYSYPSTLPMRDAIRKKIIYAGEAYKRIEIKADTAVDVDNDGALDNVTAPGFLSNDDQDALESIGQIAASWHLVNRQILRLESSRPSATPQVGQIVQTVNAGTPHASTLGTIVSEIRVTMQRSEDVEPAQYSLVTALGEMDPLAFAPDNQPEVSA